MMISSLAMLFNLSNGTPLSLFNLNRDPSSLNADVRIASCNAETARFSINLE